MVRGTAGMPGTGFLPTTLRVCLSGEFGTGLEVDNGDGLWTAAIAPASSGLGRDGSGRRATRAKGIREEREKESGQGARMAQVLLLERGNYRKHLK